MSTATTNANVKTATRSEVRLKASIRGAVQGVGFRPFVFRLAEELGLAGWIQNTTAGVLLELEGPHARLGKFLDRLHSEKPPRCSIQSVESSWLEPRGYCGFEIRNSEANGARCALVLPDAATCPDCLREMFDPTNRRYLYPFINCTNCGPRFSIIESLPYDRANTSMKKFDLCPDCRAEYEDPRDRRFHAQPNACPECGPQLELWDSNGKLRGDSHHALPAAVSALRAGRIVAVKGLGGFHLMVGAHNERAVQRLRGLKHREEKPFALLFPSLQSVQSVCLVSAAEARLLTSPEAPIVLLRRLPDSKGTNRRAEIASGVAPGNPNLGVLLPSNPLHHLLMAELKWPVVATSGNLNDEPICIDEHEAIQRLGGIADLFLVHNRPIVRHVDDSVVRVLMNRELVLRRARGYAPLPITLSSRLSALGSRPVLAVGAHLKNSVALAVGEQVFLSQHIGDLETEQANNAFRRVIGDFEMLYDTRPEMIAADLHPDYLSTRFAREHASAIGAPPPLLVQHHVAHVLSCMAENEIEGPALGVSWDGTGYGLDGTTWGGEFFLADEISCERVAHFRSFPLPGGDKAAKEPRRTAIGLLYEMLGSAAFKLPNLAPFQSVSKTESAALRHMLERGLNSPRTSSAGRLFDAIAALAGLRQITRFEGQAAMELEFALSSVETDDSYEFQLNDESLGEASLTPNIPGESERMPAIVDWSPVVKAILHDLEKGISASLISAKFHNALAEVIVAIAKRAGQERVVLSGGCFQNCYLTGRAVTRLRAEGFRAYWHQRVPPNDGGIALGQIIAARRISN